MRTSRAELRTGLNVGAPGGVRYRRTGQAVSKSRVIDIWRMIRLNKSHQLFATKNGIQAWYLSVCSQDASAVDWFVLSEHGEA